MHEPLTVTETFGLSPWRLRLRETLFMLKGNPYTPPSRFGLSSVKVLRPRLSMALYTGRRPLGRRIPVTNLYNHTPTPIEKGWSVRVTQVRDFRGKRNTYDSHNGTDFAVPPGTAVTAAAPGLVLRVSSEFHRGGLKVFIDHGHGIVTTSNHLGRALVRSGQRVRRGEPIALSGYSGVDGFLAFPFSAPHVHYNVWLDGESVDPFSSGEEPCLWRRRNDPVPYQEAGTDQSREEAQAFDPTAWDHEAVGRAIAACRDPELGAQLEREPDPSRRAMDTLFFLGYFPTRFVGRHLLYPERHVRRPLLDLPFAAEDFDGIVFLDE